MSDVIQDWVGRNTLLVSRSDPDAEPDWVDITRFIVDAGSTTVTAGKNGVVGVAEPGQLVVVLDDKKRVDETEAPDAGRFTFGNSLSPYADWWAPGRLCRWEERIAGVTTTVLTGYLRQPTEDVDLTDADADAYDMTVTITVTDLLARLADADPFVSTVAAHIIGSSRNGSLQRYWALNDSTEPFSDAFAAAPMSLALARLDPLQRTVATYQGGPSLPGDDIATFRMSYDTTYFTSPVIDPGSFETSLPLAAGDVATVVAWISPDTLPGQGLGLVTTNDSLASPTQLPLALALVDAVGAHWGATFDSGTVEAPDGVHSGIFRWSLVAVRFGYSPNVLELWVDDKTYTTTFAGTYTFANIYGPFIGAYGSMAHLQLYMGPPADFTFADFTLQRQVGLGGLDRQTTGERVRSILKYAGVAETRLSNVDRGAAVMSAAQLAGKTPRVALADAETTEQGLLYIDGRGDPVFLGRDRRYNL